MRPARRAGGAVEPVLGESLARRPARGPALDAEHDDLAHLYTAYGVTSPPTGEGSSSTRRCPRQALQPLGVEPVQPGQFDLERDPALAGSSDAVSASCTITGP